VKRLIVAIAGLCLIATAAFGFYQSRDSNYNVAISGGVSYTGPCDVVTCASGWSLRAVTNATAGTKAANICNSGDANCGDVNTLANGDFDVTSAQGGLLQCGGTGGTCTVKTLYDKISTRDLTEATISSRPLLVFSAVGGKACMSAAPNQFLVSAGTLSASQPFSMYAVAKRTSGTTAAYYIVSNSNDVGLGAIGANTAVAFNSFGTAGISATATDNVYHDIIGVWNGASPNSILTVDGVDTTGTTSGVMAGTNSMFSDGGSDTMTGLLCDGLNATSAFSGTQRTNLGNNAKTYYGYR
jgi:hypothetical protein